jgi:hypothetical protein
MRKSIDHMHRDHMHRLGYAIKTALILLILSFFTLSTSAQCQLPCTGGATSCDLYLPLDPPLCSDGLCVSGCDLATCVNNCCVLHGACTCVPESSSSSSSSGSSGSSGGSSGSVSSGSVSSGSVSSVSLSSVSQSSGSSGSSVSSVEDCDVTCVGLGYLDGSYCTAVGAVDCLDGNDFWTGDDGPVLGGPCSLDNSWCCCVVPDVSSFSSLSSVSSVSLSSVSVSSGSLSSVSLSSGSVSSVSLSSVSVSSVSVSSVSLSSVSVSSVSVSSGSVSSVSVSSVSVSSGWGQSSVQDLLEWPRSSLSM